MKEVDEKKIISFQVFYEKTIEIPETLNDVKGESYH